jgi:hypothetical protein
MSEVTAITPDLFGSESVRSADGNWSLTILPTKFAPESNMDKAFSVLIFDA